MDKLKIIAYHVIGGGVSLCLALVCLALFVNTVIHVWSWLASLGVPNFVAGGITSVGGAVVVVITNCWMEERIQRYAKKG